MKNSKNIFLILTVITVLSFIGWSIHEDKHQEIKNYLCQYHEYFMNKYTLGKNALMNLLKKKNNDVTEKDF